MVAESEDSADSGGCGAGGRGGGGGHISARSHPPLGAAPGMGDALRRELARPAASSFVFSRNELSGGPCCGTVTAMPMGKTRRTAGSRRLTVAAAETVPPPQFRLPDGLEFMQLLWTLVHTMEQRSKYMLNHIGITGPQRLALRIVGLFPGISAGDLARVVRLHPSTITGVLQRLEMRRLIMRVTHPTDQRRAVLRLTPLGERMNDIAGGTVEGAVDAALAGVGRRDRESTHRLLAVLIEQLQDQRGSLRPTRRRGG